MKFIDVKLPKPLVANTIASELESFAYSPTQNLILYIKEIKEVEGKMVTDMESYPVNPEDPVTHCFNMIGQGGVSVINTRDIRAEDPSNSALKDGASKIEEIYNFIERSEIKKVSSIPIFNTVPVEETPAAPKDMAAMYRKRVDKNDKT